MAVRARTWIWIIVGVFAAGILCFVTLAAAGLWFVKTHVHIESTSTAAPPSDFETTRKTFEGQRPLIELDDRGHFLRANTDRPEGKIRPQSLNVMAFDPHDGKVFRMDLPFWLLRLKSMGRNSVFVNGGSVDLRELHLTVEDLERYGPSLIVDHTGTDGARVLVWSQ